MTREEFYKKLYAQGSFNKRNNYSYDTFKNDLVGNEGFRKSVYTGLGYNKNVDYDTFEGYIGIERKFKKKEEADAFVQQRQAEKEAWKNRSGLDKSADVDDADAKGRIRTVYDGITGMLFDAAGGLEKAGYRALNQVGLIDDAELNPGLERIDQSVKNVKTFFSNPFSALSEVADKNKGDITDTLLAGTDDNGVSYAKSEKKYDKGEAISDEKYGVRLSDFRDDPVKLAKNLPGFIAEQGGQMILGVQTGFTSYFFSTMGQTESDWRKMAKERPELKLEEKPLLGAAYTTSMATIEALMEKLGMEAIVGKGVTKKLSKYVLDKAVKYAIASGEKVTTSVLEKAVTEIGKKITTKTGKAAINAAIGFMAEGTEEGLTTLGQDAAKLAVNWGLRNGGNDGADLFDQKEMLQTLPYRVAESTVLGGIAGAGFGGGRGFLHNTSDYIAGSYSGELETKEDAAAVKDKIANEITSSTMYDDATKRALLGYNDVMHDSYNSVPKDATPETKKDILSLIAQKKYVLNEIQNAEIERDSLDETLRDDKNAGIETKNAQLEHINASIKAKNRGEDISYSEEGGTYYRSIGDDKQAIPEVEYFVGRHIMDKDKPAVDSAPEDKSFGDQLSTEEIATRGEEAITSLTGKPTVVIPARDNDVVQKYFSEDEKDAYDKADDAVKKEMVRGKREELTSADIPAGQAIQENDSPKADNVVDDNLTEGEVVRRKKLNGWEASYELATIAQKEGVDLSKLTREEYADYAIENFLAIDDAQLRANPKNRNATNVQDVIKSYREESANITPEAESSFARFSKTMMDLAEKSQPLRYLFEGVRVLSGTKDSNSWLFFSVNNGTDNATSDTHKSYFSVKDLNRLTPDKFKDFLQNLQQSGYNGGVKIFQDLSEQGTRLNDQVVMHGFSEADAKLALDTAKSFFQDDIADSSIGKDEIIEGKSKSYSQILSDRIRRDVDERDVKSKKKNKKAGEPTVNTTDTSSQSDISNSEARSLDPNKEYTYKNETVKVSKPIRNKAGNIVGAKIVRSNGETDTIVNEEDNDADFIAQFLDRNKTAELVGDVPNQAGDNSKNYVDVSYAKKGQKKKDRYRVTDTNVVTLADGSKVDIDAKDASAIQGLAMQARDRRKKKFDTQQEAIKAKEAAVEKKKEEKSTPDPKTEPVAKKTTETKTEVESAAPKQKRRGKNVTEEKSTVPDLKTVKVKEKGLDEMSKDELVSVRKKLREKLVDVRDAERTGSVPTISSKVVKEDYDGIDNFIKTKFPEEVPKSDTSKGESKPATRKIPTVDIKLDTPVKESVATDEQAADAEDKAILAFKPKRRKRKEIVPAAIGSTIEEKKANATPEQLEDIQDYEDYITHVTSSRPFKPSNVERARIEELRKKYGKFYSRQPIIEEVRSVEEQEIKRTALKPVSEYGTKGDILQDALELSVKDYEGDLPESLSSIVNNPKRMSARKIDASDIEKALKGKGIIITNTLASRILKMYMLKEHEYNKIQKINGSSEKGEGNGKIRGDGKEGKTNDGRGVAERDEKGVGNSRAVEEQSVDVGQDAGKVEPDEASNKQQAKEKKPVADSEVVPVSSESVQDDKRAAAVEDIERRRQEELSKFGTSGKKTSKNYIKVLGTDEFVSRDLMELAYSNDNGNNPEIGGGGQTLDRIIERGGYSKEELLQLLKPEIAKINAKYDAEYVDAVKKGKMTKEQAMQALEEIGRKNSTAYAEIVALETPQAGSVGVGGDVMPLEGYHYTDKDFTEFEQPTETQSLGNGTYFYLNKRKSTKREVTSELNVKKVLDWKELKDEERSTIIKELEKAKIPTDRLNDGKLIRKVFNNIDDAKKFSYDKKTEGLNVKTDLIDGEYIVEYKEKGLSNASNGKLRGLAAEFDPNIAKRLGYDAAKLGDEIVVFDVKNTKIKPVEQSLKETTKAETKPTDVSKEEGSGVVGEVEVPKTLSELKLSDETTQTLENKLKELELERTNKLIENKGRGRFDDRLKDEIDEVKRKIYQRENELASRRNSDLESKIKDGSLLKLIAKNKITAEDARGLIIESGMEVPSEIQSIVDKNKQDKKENKQSIIERDTDFLGNEKEAYMVNNDKANGIRTQEDIEYFKSNVKRAIDNGKYQKAIADGKMTANDAKIIIESYGLKVPKEIESLLSKEQTPSQSEIETQKADIERRKQALRDLMKATGDDIFMLGVEDGTFMGEALLNMNENGDVILTRYADSEEGLTKGKGKTKNLKDIAGQFGGEQIATSGIEGGAASFVNGVVGEYHIPLQELIDLIKSEDVVFAGLGNKEFVLSPHIADKYLTKINGKQINAEYDAEYVDAVKKGVTELFESTPELANAVYEALGFKEKYKGAEKGDLINELKQITDPYLKEFADLFIQSNVNIPLYYSKGNDYAYVVPDNTLIISKGSTGIIKQKSIIHEVLHGGTSNNLLSNSDFKNRIESIINNIKKSDQQGRITFSYELQSADEFISALADKAFGNYLKQKGLFDEVFTIVKDNIIFEKGFKIAPQQKQQAQQLYAQYLSQNPNGSVEGFKAWKAEYDAELAELSKTQSNTPNVNVTFKSINEISDLRDRDAVSDEDLSAYRKFLSDKIDEKESKLDNIPRGDPRRDIENQSIRKFDTLLNAIKDEQGRRRVNGPRNQIAGDSVVKDVKALEKKGKLGSMEDMIWQQDGNKLEQDYRDAAERYVTTDSVEDGNLFDEIGKKVRAYRQSVRAAYSAGNIPDSEIGNYNKIDVSELKPVGGKEVYHLSVSSDKVEAEGFLTQDEIVKKDGRKGLGGGRGGISLTYDKSYAERLFRIFTEIKDALNGKVDIADEFKSLGTKAQNDIVKSMASAIGGEVKDIREAIENNKTTYEKQSNQFFEGPKTENVKPESFIKHYYNALSLFSDLGDREWIALHTGIEKLKDADIGIFKAKTKENVRAEILPAEREYHVYSGDAITDLERITPKENNGPKNQIATTPLLAPNGKPSNLTTEQHAMVRTPEFKAWFGDWENDPDNSSKVVDDNGEPLVVYHGTSQEFDEFLPEKLGSNTGADSAKQGFFFSDNKNVAQSYTRAHMVDNPNLEGLRFLLDKMGIVQLKSLAKDVFGWNSRQFDDTSKDDIIDDIFTSVERDDGFYADRRKYIEKAQKYFSGIGISFNPYMGGTTISAFARASNPFTFDAEGQTSQDIGLSDMISQAKQDGYDGVIIKDVYDSISFDDKGNDTESSNVVIVFESNQIKSTDNTGSFNPASNNIRNQIAAEATGFQTRDGNPIGFTYDTDKVARERFDIPNLKKIGQGSDRTVFDLGDGRVLKVAHSARGLEQNIHEGDFYLSHILPEVFERGLNYVVVENTPRLKSSDIVTTYDPETDEEVGTATAGQMIADLKKFSQTDFERRGSEFQDVLGKYGFKDIMDYDVLYGDFNAIRNWGYKDGTPMHLDGGTFGGVRMLENYKKKWSDLSDPEFRDIYYKSQAAKKEFGDTDKFTKFQIESKATPQSASTTATNAAQEALDSGINEERARIVVDLTNEGKDERSTLKAFSKTWLQAMERSPENSAFREKGLELIKDTPYFEENGKDAVKALEAAIADNAAKLKEFPRPRFTSWLKNFWQKVGQMLKINIDPADLRSMKLQDYLDIASGHLIYSNQIYRDLVSEEVQERENLSNEDASIVDDMPDFGDDMDAKYDYLNTEIPSVFAPSETERPDTQGPATKISEVVGRDKKNSESITISPTDKNNNKLLALVDQLPNNSQKKQVVESLILLAPTLKELGVSVVVHTSQDSFFNSSIKEGNSETITSLSNGFYSPDSNTIHINLQKKGLRANVAVHETVHPIITELLTSNPDTFKGFVDDIMADPELRKLYYDSFARNYYEFGVDIVKEELVTEAASSIIMERILRNLDKADDTLIQRVLNYILNALGSKYGQLATAINTRDGFVAYANSLADAISQGMAVPVSQEVRDNIEDVRNKLSVDAKRHVLSYDRKAEMIQRTDNLTAARTLEEKGVSNEDIRLATGWDNKDGKKTYNPVRTKAKSRLRIDNNISAPQKGLHGNTTTLGDIISDNDIFKKYPQIKDIPVTTQAGQNSGGFLFTKEDGSIGMVLEVGNRPADNANPAIDRLLQKAVQAEMNMIQPILQSDVYSVVGNEYDKDGTIDEVRDYIKERHGLDNEGADAFINYRYAQLAGDQVAVHTDFSQGQYFDDVNDIDMAPIRSEIKYSLDPSQDPAKRNARDFLMASIRKDSIAHPDANWQGITSRMVSSKHITQSDADEIMWAINFAKRGKTLDERKALVMDAEELTQRNKKTSLSNTAIKNEAIQKYIDGVNDAFADQNNYDSDGNIKPLYSNGYIKTTDKELRDNIIQEGSAHPEYVLEDLIEMNRQKKSGEEITVRSIIAMDELKRSIAINDIIYQSTNNPDIRNDIGRKIDALKHTLGMIASAYQENGSYAGRTLGLRSRIMQLEGISYQSVLSRAEKIDKDGDNVGLSQEDKDKLKEAADIIQANEARISLAFEAKKKKNQTKKEKIGDQILKKTNFKSEIDPTKSIDEIKAIYQAMKQGGSSSNVKNAIDPARIPEYLALNTLIDYFHQNKVSGFRKIVEAVKTVDPSITQDDVYDALIYRGDVAIDGQDIVETEERRKETLAHARAIRKLERLLTEIAESGSSDPVSERSNINPVNDVKRLLDAIRKNIFRMVNDPALRETWENNLSALEKSYDLSALTDNNNDTNINRLILNIGNLKRSGMLAWAEKEAHKLDQKLEQIKTRPGIEAMLELESDAVQTIPDKELSRLLQQNKDKSREINGVLDKYRKKTAIAQVGAIWKQLRATIGSSLAMIDLSAVGVQGFAATVSNLYQPRVVGKAFKEMFKAIGNSGYANVMYKNITDDVEYEDMMSHKLNLHNPNGTIHVLEQYGEDDWFDKAYYKAKDSKYWLARNVVSKPLQIRRWLKEKSDATFSTYLNALSFYLYKSYTASRTDKASGVSMASSDEKAIVARGINNATGRPKFDRSGEQFISSATNVLWAPRLYTSQIFNPANIVIDPLKAIYYTSKGNKEKGIAYRHRAKQSMALAVFGGALFYAHYLAAMLKCGHASIGTDHESSEYLKINCDGIVIDVSGNMVQYARMARNLYQTIVEGKDLGETPYTVGTYGILGKWLQYHLSPHISSSIQIATGKDFRGKRYDETSMAKSRYEAAKNALIPIWTGSTYDFMFNAPEIDASTKVVLSAEGLLGIGVRYTSAKEKEKQEANNVIRKAREKEERKQDKKAEAEAGKQEVIEKYGSIPVELQGEWDTPSGTVDPSEFEPTEKYFRDKKGRYRVFEDLELSGNQKNKYFVVKKRGRRSKKAGLKYKDPVTDREFNAL